MKYIAWNCRELGTPEAVDSLCDLVSQESHALIFLSKTKMFSHEMRRIKHKLHFKHDISIDDRN